MHHQQPGNFQQSFCAGGQQYALVPLNGGPAMMNSPQHHGMPPMGTGFGHSPGIPSLQVLGGPAFAPNMNGFKCVHALVGLLLTNASWLTIVYALAIHLGSAAVHGKMSCWMSCMFHFTERQDFTTFELAVVTR